MPKKMTTREKLILRTRELRSQSLKINPPVIGKVETNEESNRAVINKIAAKAKAK